MNGKMEVYPDAGALARAAAEHVIEQAAKAIAARGRFIVALAGGSTPRATYKLLADGFAARVDWPYVHVFFGDERSVPPDYDESNYRMAREMLLDRVPIPDENVHRIQGEMDPVQAAERYEAELDAVLGTRGRLDLILLGMGSDGHTASLFPGTSALEERERRVVENYVDKLDAWRVTLTLPAIDAARQVTFLVSGATKAEAMARIQAGEPLPAGLVRPAKGQLTWLVDRDVLD